MAAPRVTVVVNQRESLAHTARSLASLYANAGTSFALVYVDSGAPPAVARLIDTEAASRGFRVIRQDRFLDANAGRNLALAASESEYVVFADNDLIFGVEWLSRLIACADETGADLVGPLICCGRQPFAKVHSVGGDVRVIDEASGRRFYHLHSPLLGNVHELESRFERREPGMLELHCLLVRRALFARIGPLDEGLRSAFTHWDLTLTAREAGAKLINEPSSRVHFLEPPPFPIDIRSIPFLYQRWSRERNRASFERFRAKWRLPADDRTIVATRNWHDDRRDVPFRYLRPDIYRHGSRRLRRELARVLPGLF